MLASEIAQQKTTSEIGSSNPPCNIHAVSCMARLSPIDCLQSVGHKLLCQPGPRPLRWSQLVKLQLQTRLLSYLTTELFVRHRPCFCVSFNDKNLQIMSVEGPPCLKECGLSCRLS